MVNEFLIPFFLLVSHWLDWLVTKPLNQAHCVFNCCLGIHLRNQKWSSSHYLSLYFIVSNKCAQEILNCFSELLPSVIKMSLLYSQDKFELGSLWKSTVVEISIGEDAVETVGITIARLIQEVNSFECTVLFSQADLEGIGDLCFRLSSEANCSGGILQSSWSIDEVSILVLCPEGRVVGKNMARRGLPHLSKSKHSDRLVEGLE